MSKHITVAELITELQKVPQHLPVYADGCDCIGAACGVEVVMEAVPDYMHDIYRERGEIIAEGHVLVARLEHHR